MSISMVKWDMLAYGYVWSPIMGVSSRFKHWVSIDDLRRCISCEDMHGKIWYIYETPEPEPPLHENGRCEIEPMETIQAGTATVHGTDGADYAVKMTGQLPSSYVVSAEAKMAGWAPGKWPSNFIPGKMIGGDVYRNKDGHLPDAPGRVWYEADINYVGGKRNNCRIVYSNDGLVFASYDHYETFYEIV